MRFANVERILIVKFKHIGDVLVSVPTLRALRATFPDARIGYLLNADTAAMVEDHPALDEVLRLHRDRGIRHQLALLWALRRRRYDLTVDLSGGGDRGAIWSFLTGARYRIGTLPTGRQGMRGKRHLYTHLAPTPDARLHTVMRDLAIVRPFGIDAQPPIMDLHGPDETRQAMRQRLTDAGIPPGTPYVVVHPTSRWLFKCANDAAMGAIIDGLAQTGGLAVVVTCGPRAEELARLDTILGHCATRPIVFRGDLALKQLAAVLAGARLYVGVDSAPSHMAAALDVPSVVLFGPTGAYNWGPWPNSAETHPYPERRGLQRAGRHVVIQQDWPCVPCGKAGCENSRVSDCLMATDPAVVLGEAERLLGGTP
jgi:heptosyltransferase-3